jgi:CheY-like chemotaxis protein
VVWHPGGGAGLTILYNVLVVDDDEEMRAATVAALRSRPNLRVVAQVGTARAAIGRARSIALDLIVLDDRLGVGPRGIEIAPTLRRLAKFAYIVLFTAHRPDTPVEQLDGIDAVVVKPDFELLVDTCSRFLAGVVDVDLTADSEAEAPSPEQA